MYAFVLHEKSHRRAYQVAELKPNPADPAVRDRIVELIQSPPTEALSKQMNHAAAFLYTDAKLGVENGTTLRLEMWGENVQPFITALNEQLAQAFPGAGN